MFSLRHGGAERYSLDLARALAQAGNEVHLIGTLIENAPPECPVHLLHLSTRLKWRQQPAFIAGVQEFLRHNKFDITFSMMHCFGVDMVFLGGGVHAHHMRVRFPNFFVRMSRYLTHPNLLLILHQERQLYSAKMPARLVANSHYVERTVQEYYPVPPHRLAVVHHGVNHAVFHPGVQTLHREQTRRELKIADHELAILIVANNWRLKGLATIIRAVQALGPQAGDCKIIVVGKGKPWQYQTLVARLGLPDVLRFVGLNAEVARFYAAADVFALPTQCDPFAVVTLEAMACGLPTITSAANGASEVIEPERTGLILQNAGDVMILAEYLRRLFDAAYRRRLGAAAAQAALSYTQERNARQMLEIMRAIVAERCPAGRD